MPPSASALTAFGLKPMPCPLRLVRRPRLCISFTPENPFENAQARVVFNRACKAGLLEALLGRYSFCMEGGTTALLIELPPEQVTDPSREEVLENFEAELDLQAENTSWLVDWVDPFVCLIESSISGDTTAAVNEAFHQLNPLALHVGHLEMTYEQPRRRSRCRRRPPVPVQPLQQA